MRMDKHFHVFVLLCLGLCITALNAATYYVDFDSGSDSNSGTSTGAAWQHCPGDSNASGTPASTTLAGGDTVIFKGGVHYLGTISINASGSSGNPIVFDGNSAGTFGTGKAILDGADPLTGFTACTSQTDAQGCAAWANMYKVSLPSGVGPFDANLFEDETLLQVAQEPDPDDTFFYDVTDNYYSVAPANVTFNSGTGEVTITDTTNLTQSSSSDWDGAYIHFWQNPNIVSTNAVEAYNASTKTLTFSIGSGNPYTDKNSLYAMANSPLTLDQAGEYFVDESTNTLYLWPHTSNVSSEEFWVSTRGYGISISMKDHITIQNFRIMRYSGGFDNYDGSAIRASNANYITLTDNEIAYNRSMNKWAGVDFRLNSSYVTLTDNYVHENLRCRGFMIGADNVEIADNLMYKNGGTGIYLGGSDSSSIHDNTVLNHLGTHANGITLYQGCTDCTVTRNWVQGGLVALTTQDADGIEIAYNVLLTDVTKTTYADWSGGTHSSQNLTLYNNLIVGSEQPAISLGSLSESGMVFKNNVVLGGGPDEATTVRANNVYLDLAWYQSSNYGWSLATGEIDASSYTFSQIFEDFDDDDFSPCTGSPLLEAGADVGYSYDFDYNSVPVGYVDAGPYQVSTGSANLAPTADAGSDQSVTDSDDSGSESVTLDGTGSSDSDGTIVSYVWTENSTQIATGSQPSVNLSVGTHTITLTVTDDDSATDTDTVVITVNEPSDGPVLTVTETTGDYYTVKAHDASNDYWELKVDIQSGGIFSFKDLTDAGDGSGGHTSYCGTDAATRRATLLYFDGRNGNVMTRNGSVTDLDDRLTFTTAGDGSSFTISYTEDSSSTGYFHESYSDGSYSLTSGDLYTTIELVITPPDENGTNWSWSVENENVSGHELSGKIWAAEYIYTYMDENIIKTGDYDTTLADGAWDDADPESFLRWTIGSNSSLGLTTGREFIMDVTDGLSDQTNGATVSTGNWAGFDYLRLTSGFNYDTNLLADNATRVYEGNFMIDIAAVDPNQAPTADAGSDQSVFDSGSNGSESVTLDGTGSSDSDGTIASYVWTENSSQIATGSQPTVSLSVGTHTITLTVTDNDGATDTDTVVVTVNAGATLSVVETTGDYYTVTAHEDGNQSNKYWEIKVDIQSGGIFSFKDYTDAGDGSGGHTDYCGNEAYNRQATLLFFDGRGGNVFTRNGALTDLDDRLIFTTAGDGSSFTITYTENSSSTDYFHDVYSAGSYSLAVGDLYTTIQLVITPPDENGTSWDWSIDCENVSGHDLSGKIWAAEYTYSYLLDDITVTTDYETSLLDGEWYDADPESFMRWTLGSNSSLGLTTGRELIMDITDGLESETNGGTVSTGDWAGYNYIRYTSGFNYDTNLLGDEEIRTVEGKFMIDIAVE